VASITLALGASVLLPALDLAQAASITVDRNVMVAMRDGVRLATDIYRPAGPGPYPAILVRTPYGKGGLSGDGTYFAEHGYAYVSQDTRGRFDSEGDFDVYVQDDADGLDTALWLNAQAWFDRQRGFGVYGDSYLASTALSVAEMRPPNLQAAYIAFASANYHDDGAWRGGAFQLAHNVVFTAVTACPNLAARTTHAQLLALLPSASNTDGLFALEDATPLDQDLLGNNCPWYHTWVINSDQNGYWDQLGLNHTAYFDQLPPIPIAFLSGWYDQFLGGTIIDYQGAPADVSLTIGPWVHDQPGRPSAGDGAFGQSATLDRRAETLHWFNRYLAGGDADSPQPNTVRYFLMGGGPGVDRDGQIGIGGSWQTAPSWPPPDVQYTPYYLHASGQLSPDPPVRRSEPPDTYDYDPHDPVPTIGGNISSGLIFAPAGAYVQRCRSEWPACRGSTDELAARPDVLSYTSDPLDQDLVVTGPLSVELYAATSAADTDFTAKLVDLYPNGDAVNVADGIIRARYRSDKTSPHFVTPGRVNMYTIDLWHTAMRFVAGHRLRLDISSSNFPHFDRNLNTGNPIGSDVLDNAVIATQRVFHDALHPSYILLPVLPADADPAD
jgi:putative CocE/NonD family hydrolase